MSASPGRIDAGRPISLQLATASIDRGAGFGSLDRAHRPDAPAGPFPAAVGHASRPREKIRMQDTDSLIKRLPKCKLHIHIEGSLEPEMVFALARRNGIRLPYPSVEALRQAYRFSDLQDFLNIYYQSMSVLV